MSNAIHLVEMNAKISNRNETTVVWKQGMTLVEVLMAVAIIGLLAVLIVPAINLAIRSRENAQCARKLHAAVLAFELYKLENGTWPVNTSLGVRPAEMADYYFPYYGIATTDGVGWWMDTPEIGGQWDWDNLQYNGKYYCVVCVANPTATTAQMEEIDRMLDDGNLSSGSFQKGFIKNSANSNDYGYLLGTY